MSTLRFKTNIQCGGCIATVTPFLNAEPAVTNWKVDTNVPEKILSVDTNLSATDIIAIITKAGYKAESI